MAMFFSRAVSLETWVKSGLFDREKVIYEEHLKKGNFERIYWFTYGSKDGIIASQLKKEGRLDKKIIVIPMPARYLGKAGINIYSLMLPFVHRKILKECEWKKSNQMDGAWTPYIAKKISGGLFSLRTGYTISLVLDQDENTSGIKRKIYHMIEKFLYKRADISFVSSEHDKTYLCKQYHICSKKITVLRNYIDTQKFYNKRDDVIEDKRIIFVGRLNVIKNIFNIIKAVNRVGYGIDIYGNGELYDPIKEFIETNHYNAVLKGYTPNDRLPELINQYKYFILASKSEGMPKSLLEAMACGRICIGTDVAGINELITDGETGFLADSVETVSIEQALIRAIECTDKDRISKNAENLIREKFSISTITKIELESYMGLER